MPGKKATDIEESASQPKKKKLLSSKGWSMERKLQEQQYNAQMFKKVCLILI
jgi:hypothetical protein